MKMIFSAWLVWMLAGVPAFAATVEYHLTIERSAVNITGKPARKVTVNGGIPGPLLKFTEGDEAVIHVTNTMQEQTSIHWHGLLLPPGMDGVPGLGGFDGIDPGETFTYRFPIRQHGTYWYHAHSLAQEQDGQYGGMVITPKGDEPVEASRDYALVLSDYAREDGEEILANLKKSAEYYQNARLTLGDFVKDAREQGFSQAWRSARDWGKMRMLRTDLSDVTGYTFLVNGHTPGQNWTGVFRQGETVRLRVINASAMTFFDVRLPGLEMIVVSADGREVKPVTVDELRIGPAETYDVLVKPQEDKAYTFAAEPVDRTGFALATLAPRAGMKGPEPAPRPRARLTMTDMGMEHIHHSGMEHDMANMPPSGWAQTGAPEGTRTLSYSHLKALHPQPDIRQPERELEVRLGGNMERYIWTLNGKKYSEAGPVSLRHGERVRLIFINETMMAHPMHLHGMFMKRCGGDAGQAHGDCAAGPDGQRGVDRRCPGGMGVPLPSAVSHDERHDEQGGGGPCGRTIF